jgi:hypothetical protein
LNKLDILIQEKEAELKNLRQEWEETFRFAGDIDFEYAALLYPIIGQVARDIDRLKALQYVSETGTEGSFPSYIEQLLTAQWRSLEIQVHFSEREYGTAPLMEIHKVKGRRALRCKLMISESIAGWLYDPDNEFRQIGWTPGRSKNVFYLYHPMRTEEDKTAFFYLMSRTLMDPFSQLWKACQQYYYLKE